VRLREILTQMLTEKCLFLTVYHEKHISRQICRPVLANDEISILNVKDEAYRKLSDIQIQFFKLTPSYHSLNPSEIL